jgi:hypothetical protein
VLRTFLVVAAAALVVPVSAQGALSFAFDRAKARPGQLVHAYQAASDLTPAPAWERLDNVTLYLARVKHPFRRVRLGEMEIDDQGVWSIDFRVPRVAPGLYTIAFFCGPCGDTYFSSVGTDERWTGKPGRVLKVRR